MEFLKYRQTITFLAAITAFFFHCSRSGPTAAENSEMSIRLTASVTAVQPDMLEINLYNDNGFHEYQEIAPVQNNGRTDFFNVPYGWYYVDINGKVNNNRVLYGHNAFDVQIPDPVIPVSLRNIIEVKYLNDVQEGQFLVNTVRSSMWDNIPAVSTARCLDSNNKIILRTLIASGTQYLYFLFEINDEISFTDDREPTNLGELTNDAVIVYLCPLTPHEMSPPVPAVRFQFETGRTILNSGLFSYMNFPDNASREDPISALINDDITARISRQVEQKVLELRIRKEILRLPASTERNWQMLGLVIRYRDGNTGQLSDWQTGNQDVNPRNNIDAWGYLEINPELQ